MLQNYLKIAARHLLKNRLYSSINILGLSIGMACFILIGLYVQYEFSYDTQHRNAHRIYRIAQQQPGDFFRGSDLFALTPAPLAKALNGEFPEVEKATTITLYRSLLGRGEQFHYEQGLFVDQYLFDVFSYPVLEGQGKEALTDPNSILLTESAARKFFPDQSPIGKSIEYQDDKTLTIRGIVADLPANQHFSFDFITALQNLPYYDEDDVWYSNTSWYSNNYYTYALLHEGDNHKELEEKLTVIDNRLEARYFTNEQKPIWLLQPLLDIHLHSRINFEMGINSDIRYVWLAISIALIILTLAAINYMNLAIARSADRAKEVGMRKVMGARRQQLTWQFLGESFLLSLISFCIALCLANITLPLLNRMLAQSIPFSFGENNYLLILLLIFTLVVGSLSGLYPAAFLARVAPAKAFRGGFLKGHRKGLTIRNLLVTGQFSIAIMLTIGSLIVFQQLQYIQNKKVGFSRDQIIHIPYRQQEVPELAPTLQAELQRHPGIEQVSVATYLPLNMNSQGNVDQWEGNEDQSEFRIYRNYVDYNYIDLFEMEIIEGRNFSPAHPSDSTEAYILNEAAVKGLGWDSAVGRRFDRGKVIGVVKDFHFQPFRLAIEPIYLKLQNQFNGSRGSIIVKTRTDNLAETADHLEATMKTVLPKVPFNFEYLDHSYQELYGFERRLGQAFFSFTFLALFIAAIGLFGLVAQQVSERYKEIGIRKVLGATLTNITSLLSREFLKLVVFASLIAFPIAWLGATSWLKNFAYRVDIQWWTFAIAGLAALFIAALTVGIHTWKVAAANPVDALRNE